MGFTDIHIVGCDCDGKYTRYKKDWIIFKETILPNYPEVNITIVNKVNLDFF
jgi:hypothetical protein